MLIFTSEEVDKIFKYLKNIGWKYIRYHQEDHYFMGIDPETGLIRAIYRDDPILSFIIL